MASKKNIIPVEISSSSSDSSIDPTTLPYAQDLMEGQESPTLPTQELEEFEDLLTPKQQSRLEAKKALKSRTHLSLASQDMFPDEPTTSTNYEYQPLHMGTIDRTDTEDLGTIDLTETEELGTIRESIDQLSEYCPRTEDRTDTEDLGTIDLTETEQLGTIRESIEQLSEYCQPKRTLRDTFDLVEVDETEDFLPAKKVKLASEFLQSQSQEDPGTSGLVHYTLRDTLDLVEDDDLASEFLQSQSQSQESQDPGTSGLVHYTGKLTERNLKNVLEESRDKGENLNQDGIETLYALHCAKFLREFLIKRQPHSSERREQMKKNIEKISFQKAILDL